MFRFRSTPLPFCSVIKIIRELGDFELKDFGGHGTAFKFAALFVDAEQTEVHGTDIFCRVNVNQALRRSLASNTLRTGIHYRCANGCVTEQTERETFDVPERETYGVPERLPMEGPLSVAYLQFRNIST